MTSATSKKEILLNYVTDIELNGIQQHTKEWLKAKECVVGGSQMAAIVGMNEYENSMSAAMGKLGFKEIEGKFKMSWGNVFEDIIKNYVERYFNTTIYADNAFIPLDCGPLAGHVAYSPDGLCIIDNNTLIAKYGGRYSKINELKPDEDSIVLLEFKAPYSRRTDPEKIPDYYIPQPLTGMDVIGPVVDGNVQKICDMSLFIECEFRLCEYAGIDLGREHCKYPTNHPESTKAGKAHAFGLFIVYGPEEGSLYEEIINCFGSADMDNILSTMDKKTIDDIFVAIDEKRLVSLHTGPCKEKKSLKRRRKDILDNPAKSRNGLSHDIDGLVPYGTVFWKLLTFRAKPVFPEHDYLMTYHDDIVKFTDAVKKCKGMSKKDAQGYLFEQFEESRY